MTRADEQRRQRFISISTLPKDVTAKDVDLDLPDSKSKKASESSSGAISLNSNFQSFPSNQPGVSYLYAGASVVRASGGGGNRTPVRK